MKTEGAVSSHSLEEYRYGADVVNSLEMTFCTEGSKLTSTVAIGSVLIKIKS